METIKINESLKNRLINALRKGEINIQEFPEMESHNIPAHLDKLTPEDIDFLMEITNRLTQHPDYEKSQTIEIDQPLKVKILKALYNGFANSQDFQELSIKVKEFPHVDVSFDEQIRLWAIVRKTENK